MQGNGKRIDFMERVHVDLTMGMSTLEIMGVASDKDRVDVTLQMVTCMLGIGKMIRFMALEDIITTMATGTSCVVDRYMMKTIALLPVT